MALKTLRRSLVALFATTVLLTSGTRLWADTIAYAVGDLSDTTSVFGTLDLNTGAFSQISTLNGFLVEDLALSSTGTLYVLAGPSSGGNEFATINTSTGAITDIAAVSAAFTSLAFSPDGTLYASTYSPTQEALYILNPATGASSFVTDLQGPLATESSDIRFLGNTLYTTLFATPNGLYSVNLSNGDGTLIGTTGLPAYTALTGVVNGDLAATTTTSGDPFDPGELALINPATGEATVGASTNLLYNFVPIATPEPGSLSLLAGGLVLVAALVSRLHRERAK
jgi:hypothetical protein